MKAVQAHLGHASAKVTFDVYGHLWPDEEDRTRAAVDDLLGRVREHSDAAPASSPRPGQGH